MEGNDIFENFCLILGVRRDIKLKMKLIYSWKKMICEDCYIIGKFYESE